MLLLLTTYATVMYGIHTAYVNTFKCNNKTVVIYEKHKTALGDVICVKKKINVNGKNFKLPKLKKNEFYKVFCNKKVK